MHDIPEIHLIPDEPSPLIPVPEGMTFRDLLMVSENDAYSNIDIVVSTPGGHQAIFPPLDINFPPIKPLEVKRRCGPNHFETSIPSPNWKDSRRRSRSFSGLGRTDIETIHGPKKVIGLREIIDPRSARPPPVPARSPMRFAPGSPPPVRQVLRRINNQVTTPSFSITPQSSIDITPIPTGVRTISRSRSGFFRPNVVIQSKEEVLCSSEPGAFRQEQEFGILVPAVNVEVDQPTSTDSEWDDYVRRAMISISDAEFPVDEDDFSSSQGSLVRHSSTPDLVADVGGDATLKRKNTLWKSLAKSLKSGFGSQKLQH